MFAHGANFRGVWGFVVVCLGYFFIFIFIFIFVGGLCVCSVYFVICVRAFTRVYIYLNAAKY